MSDTVIIIPGNLGSTLINRANSWFKEPIWINPVALASGGFSKLRLIDGADQPGISIVATEPVELFYGMLDLGLNLHGLQTRPYPYDWRKASDVTAGVLASMLSHTAVGDRVHLVSHSFGCTVARKAIHMLASTFDEKFVLDHVGQVIFIAPAFLGCFIAAQGICASTKGIPLLGSFPQPGPKAQEATRTFESLYELLPWQPSVFPSLAHNNVAGTLWWGSHADPDLIADLVGDQGTYDIKFMADQCAVIIGDSRDETAGGMEWNNGQIQPDESNLPGDGFVPRISSLVPNVRTFISYTTSHLQLPSNHNVIQAAADLIHGKAVTSLPAY